MKQHFFVGGQYLGWRNIPDSWRPVPSEPKRTVSSYHYFCSHCGEVWGVLKHEAPDAHNQVIIRPCLRHSHKGWGGNLSSPPEWGGEIPSAFTKDWPDAAILYEFRVYMRHIELAEKELASCH